jgi:hypothetical protein
MISFNELSTFRYIDIMEKTIEEAVKEFKKNDFVSLEDGLKRTIDWQRNLY